MAESKKVFITPSVFFAFVDRAHPKHDQAAAYFRYFALSSYQLYTNNLGINATYQRIYDDMSRSLAKDFLRIISVSDINIIYADEADTKAALKTLVNYKTTDLTFEEALMSVQAYKRNISYICTFDYLHPLFGIGSFYLPI